MSLRSIGFASVICATLLGCVTTSTQAADVEGVISQGGSEANLTVSVTPAGEKRGTNLCRGDLTTRIAKLTDMTVRVSGQSGVIKHGDSSCFEPSGFKVIKLSSGRSPIVGTLAKNGSGYVVMSDGVNIPLGTPPRSLREMVGKKVIVDAKPMAKPNSADKTWNVVSYAEYP